LLNHMSRIEELERQVRTLEAQLAHLPKHGYPD